MAGFVDKFKRMWDAPDDEYQQEYDEYGYADENEEEEVEEQQPVREREQQLLLQKIKLLKILRVTQSTIFLNF